ncbi:uncharacterized protein LOC119341569 [Triticum dicoccoides]|uniref:uncharacterized protein LOC119341569 n=1 Tax=Triticum dicoccoides TaxID=85692 RepID=UPI001890FAD7|nr:uncharacterized protein LOC119341569 [Triticum dicoccoides]
MAPRRAVPSRSVAPLGRPPASGRAVAPRRAARAAAALPAVPASSAIPLVRKRKRDGFFPFLSSVETARNRKRCKFLLKRLRAHNKGEHTLASPLHPDWVGFSLDEVGILKAFYPKRSYYGGPDYRCNRCQASFWWRERVKSQSAITKRRVAYNNCCKAGKVFVKPFEKPPSFLADLLDYKGPPRSLKFIKQIRQYNCLFAFTSMGAKINRSINDGGGPKIFKINGQVCHRIGSLLPNEGDSPKYAELYIHDRENEVSNRIQALSQQNETGAGLDKEIVKGLMQMLDANNSLVKKFRMASEILKNNKHEVISIRLIAPRENDSAQFNLPATDELAALVYGEFTLEAPCRDLIIRTKADHLCRISSLDTTYMPLQYPLLFPYGERGFQLGVRYIDSDSDDPNKRVKMTMQDFYCFCSHYKPEQHNPYLCCGLLSSQAAIDF